jgi:hypothetical protein
MIDFVNANYLSQLTDQPTRNDNILDHIQNFLVKLQSLMVLSNFDSQIQSISGLWFSKRFEKRACRLSDIKLLQFILMIFIVGVFCFADYRIKK